MCTWTHMIVHIIYGILRLMSYNTINMVRKILSLKVPHLIRKFKSSILLIPATWFFVNCKWVVTDALCPSSNLKASVHQHPNKDHLCERSSCIKCIPNTGLKHIDKPSASSNTGLEFNMVLVGKDVPSHRCVLKKNYWLMLWVHSWWSSFTEIPQTSGKG